ncbi:MAG: decarboxylase, partial [Burkholderiales bacterium]
MTERAHRNYGQRARIGMIVPPTNTVNEAEWARMVPDGVTLHAMRMPLHEDIDTDAGRRRLFDDLAAALALLMPAGPDVACYCCTAGSMLSPLNRIGDTMRQIAGVPAVA